MRVHSGVGGIDQHLAEFRKGIFSGLNFSLDDFVTEGLCDKIESLHVEKLKEHLVELITQLGGSIVPSKILASIWIFYKDNEFARAQ
jgi:hypothetical protein